MILNSLWQILCLLWVLTLITADETSCNPTQKSCPADPALGTEHEWYFNTTLDTDLWDMQTGNPKYKEDGADFSISHKGSSTLLVSNFYIFFGVMEAHVKMAKGAGIISSVILQSDDLDEIDWEWVGYNTSGVQSDFFGKGNTTTSDRGGYHGVENADTEFHNYTSYWTKDRLEWWIDGDLVRTVNYTDPFALYGKNYPQSPCQVKVSVWPVGIEGQSQGNLEWGGGLVDWSQTPFTMTVQKIRVQDFHTGKEYKYTDQSGSYESVKVISPNTNSTAVRNINKPPPKDLSDRWNGLSEGAHIGIYVAVAIVTVGSIGTFVLWCSKQRRKGRLQRALDDSNYAAELQTIDGHQKWAQTSWRQESYQQMK